MAANDIDYNFDPTSLLAALKQVNRAFADVQSGAKGAGDQWNTAFTSLADKLVKTNDRVAQSHQRLVRSIEQQARAYGASGVDRLIQQRDAMIKRLGDEEQLVKRVTAAYDKMIQVERQRQTGGGGGGGIGGLASQLGGAIPGVGAARGFAPGIMEAAGALGSLGLALGGAAVGMVGLGVATYKATEFVTNYATEVRRAQVITGLSAADTQRLQFVMKATGTDVGALQGTMRALSSALEDHSLKSQRVRTEMQRMGIDVLGLQTGTV